MSNKRFRGYSLKFVVNEVVRLVKETDARTLLDYGCGKGLQYTEGGFHEAWGGIMPVLYDPGVPGLDALPVGVFDGVICTDVLEHIPEEELSVVIERLGRYARRFAVLSIHIGPSRKTFPDGRNLHVTQRSPEWWKAKLEGVFAPDVTLFVGFSNRG